MFGDPFFFQELVIGAGEIALAYYVLRLMRDDSTRRYLSHLGRKSRSREDNSYGFRLIRGTGTRSW